MRRTFIRELGRYKVGTTEDYPRGVWEQIGRSAVAQKLGIKSIEDFSRPVEDVAKAGAKSVRAAS